jgi:glycosyltransferase involved in cell wall biosynthesis
MASGCPVAASDAAAIPEVAGEAAVLFNPASAAAIAAGILDALEASTSLAREGLAHASGFTWDANAAAHDIAYSELLP